MVVFVLLEALLVVLSQLLARSLVNQLGCRHSKVSIKLTLLLMFLKCEQIAFVVIDHPGKDRILGQVVKAAASILVEFE